MDRTPRTASVRSRHQRGWNGGVAPAAARSRTDASSRWAPTVEQQSAVAFPARPRRRARASGRRIPPRAPLLALGLTCVWLVANIRHPSPVDVLPFLWVWLTLWLALSVLQTLGRWCLRALSKPRPRA